MPERDRDLLKAVKSIDPTFFGLVFDLNFSTLSEKMPHDERMQKAFELTAENEIIQKSGIRTVVKKARNPEWSKKFLSPRAQEALTRFVQPQS